MTELFSKKVPSLVSAVTGCTDAFAFETKLAALENFKIFHSFESFIDDVVSIITKRSDPLGVSINGLLSTSKTSSHVFQIFHRCV